MLLHHGLSPFLFLCRLRNFQLQPLTLSASSRPWPLVPVEVNQWLVRLHVWQERQRWTPFGEALSLQVRTCCSSLALGAHSALCLSVPHRSGPQRSLQCSLLPSHDAFPASVRMLLDRVSQVHHRRSQPAPGVCCCGNSNRDRHLER